MITIKNTDTGAASETLTEALDRLARSLDRLVEAMDRAAPKPAPAPKRRNPW